MHGLQPLAVREVLSAYARRGVFRSFTEEETSKGPAYRFHWLWNAPFAIQVDTRTGTIAFPSLLPGVARGSELHNGIQDFLRDCASPERPDHRRLDPSRIAVTFTGRALKFRIKKGDHSEATKQAIAVVNELFVSYLSTHYPSYLTEHFHVAED